MTGVEARRQPGKRLAPDVPSRDADETEMAEITGTESKRDERNCVARRLLRGETDYLIEDQSHKASCETKPTVEGPQ